MNTTHEFTTHSDQRWYAGLTAVTFILIGIVSAVGTWIWFGTPGPALMVLLTALFCGAIMVLILKKQPNAQLHFVADELHITHVDGKRYEVYAVPASDFLCRQSTLERKYNVGRIQIKGTIFYFYGIQNFAETRRYIQESFPDY